MSQYARAHPDECHAKEIQRRQNANPSRQDTGEPGETESENMNNLTWGFDGEFTWIAEDQTGSTLGYVFDKSATAPCFVACLPAHGQAHKGHLNTIEIARCDSLEAAKAALVAALPK